MRSLSVWNVVLGWISRALEPEDRDAVLGDLAEEGLGPLHSVASIADLLLRRQLAEWHTYRPWIALLLVLAPSAILLAVVSQNLADGNAIVVWLFASNWDGSLLHQPGFWNGLLRSAPHLLLSAGALISWAWSSGFVIGSASRRTIRTFRIGICLAGLLLWLGFIDAPHGALFAPSARGFPGNHAVFTDVYYDIIFPIFVQVGLVLLPLLRGLHDAHDQPRFDRSRLWLLWSLLTLALFSLATQALGWWQYRTWNVVPAPQPHLPSLLAISLTGLIAWGLVQLTELRRSSEVA